MISRTEKMSAARYVAALLVFMLPSVWGVTGLSAAEAPLAPPEQALLRVIFEPNDWTIGQPELEELDAFAADFIKRSGRLELKAYAGPPHDTSSTARRLALRRALSVRRELMDKGIAVDRIYVRALGGTSDSGAPDRVDIRLFGG